ncbi:phage tail tape measure protein [Paenibacillus elgii]
MASNSQFLVSMKFVGVDQLSPTTRRMIDEMRNVKRSAQNMFNGMKSPKMFDDMARALRSLSGQIDQVQKKLDHMKSSGMGNMLSGGAALATMIKPINQAGEIQMQSIQLGGAYGLEQSSEKLKEIKEYSKELSTQTLFSQKEIMGIGLELAHAQISKENLKPVMKEASFLSEVEVGMGKSSSAGRSAYNFARMAEDARITSDVSAMEKFADNAFRVINVTHASTEGLGETFKYAMPVVKNLGWNETDMLMSSAMGAIHGMEGSMAGTHIKDFAERINPYKFLNTRGGAKQLSAMNDAGLLEGVEYDKKGKIIGFKNAALLKDKDSLKSYVDMVGVLTKKHKEFIAAGNSELEWAAKMNHIFGEQGQDFAIISSHQETFDKLMKSINSQKGLHKQIDEIRESYKGQAHILQSKIENLTTSIGNHLLPEITKLISAISPGVTTATKWIDAHRDEVVVAGKVVAAFGTFMLALGAAKLAFGTIGTLLTGPLKTGINTVAKMLEALGAKKAADKLKDTLPSKSIQANVVNVYGKAINNLGGGPGGGGGTFVGAGGGRSGNGGELPPRSSTHGGGGRGGGFGKFLTWGKNVLGRGGSVVIPAVMAMSAWDVMSAPEGKKVETAVKTSGTIIGGWAGAEAGAAMGAALGSVVPGIGNAVGAALGGVIGAVVGSSIADSITNSIFGSARRAKETLLQEQSDQAEMAASAQYKENEKQWNEATRRVNWWKVDTSKYTARENSATSNTSNRTYNDNSRTYIYEATSPGAIEDQITGNKANIARRRFLEANSH